ncbi:hypothetical protein GIB67_024727 [Kingdonia uniflora]|uniref:Uncharacterized protein n=1 Tax=Kingdonia uniflora TaxID=39325 RepID=A0A7J7NA50_9MAGN|nr:hypothetical protein GIB67_024727 [Kingdonia uniflora]
MDPMEPGSSSEFFDKSEVLDVKPLCCLVPQFAPPPPGFNSPSPFLVPNIGTDPSRVSHFYPFFNPSDFQKPPEQSKAQMPNGHINEGEVFGSPSTHEFSFRSPPPPSEPLPGDDVNGEVETGQGTSKNTVKTTAVGGNGDKRGSKDDRNVENRRSGSSSKKRRSVRVSGELGDADRDSVAKMLLKYEALRRRISQIQEAEDLATSAGKRADCKASTIIINRGLRVNEEKRIGHVPGVEVGDIFYFRTEMCVLGVHLQTMAGIDYMTLKGEGGEETLAVSIVYSGVYENEVDDKDSLIYSGQGGKTADQKLERGNLALERSLRRGNEVRVTRCVKDVMTKDQRVYVYDGLYKIHESWTQISKGGCSIFKYKLLRVPGQPEAFGIWKSIQQWKSGMTRPGLILPDLTSGAEKVPVALVNDVDDEKRGPSIFTYIPTLKYPNPILRPSIHCSCTGSCLPGDPNCACIVKNEGDLPYTGNGVLVIQKPFIYECGPNCLCPPNCRNKVSQNGLRVQLEVFKTKDRGWGLRSWDPIRAGTFICEYAGEVVDDNKENVGDEEDDSEDDYTFVVNSTFENSKSSEWNYIPELLGERKLHHSSMNEKKSELSLTINAKNYGNIGRFMNHSCSPNTFWQPVLHDHGNESYPHIMFYAIKHIPPMTELTFDYGTRGTHGGKKICLCGSSMCRSLFG